MLGTFHNWVEIVGRTLAEEGIDLGARLDELGQGRTVSSAGASRLDPKLSKTIWGVVEDSTGDPVFGLSMLRGVDFHDFEDLGVALVASGTAEAAVQRIVRYHGLISDRVSIGLEIGQRVLEVRIEHLDHWRANEFSAALITRVLRARFDRSLNPIEVRLGFVNEAGQATYARYFRCPVAQGAAITGLSYDRLALGRYRAHESAGMADRFDELLRARERELARATSTVGAVRHALVSTMGKDPPSLERVAASMHVSERTLQRRLADEGSSFAQILDATRRELAESWLAENQLSRTEIAYLLGFAQPSSFSRALRRWEEHH
jgi:AraC-like DNA-binding protein